MVKIIPFFSAMLCFSLTPGRSNSHSGSSYTSDWLCCVRQTIQVNSEGKHSEQTVLFPLNAAVAEPLFSAFFYSAGLKKSLF